MQYINTFHFPLMFIFIGSTCLLLVLIIIKNSPNKSCDIDPFLTLLLKSCINEIIFPVTTNINISMQGGVVPRDFKKALVNHLFKKQALCKNYLKNDIVDNMDNGSHSSQFARSLSCFRYN